MKSKIQQTCLFLLLSLLVSIPIYRDAMWGASLLAPLDIGPFAFENYKFMTDKPVEVPDNHFIIDQFTYDLPLQKRIYDSYRNGEIPWWDPYTYGGRPLLADAHINGTDPLRVALYLTLPFELAYNWNLIFKGILSGLGMFLLLRYAGVRCSVAIILGITYQFAGWFTVHFGHPWIQASFAYFPFIWLAWLKAESSKSLGIPCATAGILCAAVFYSGNLQSHTYLPLFALVYLLSDFMGNRRFPIKAIITTGLSGIIGALLAWPVLVNQLEFYVYSTRPIADSPSLLGGLATLPVSLLGFFPWVLGTFRTIQPARALGVPSIEFHLLFATISSILIFIACIRRKDESPLHLNLTRTSQILIAAYLVIVCTPLSSLFYSRIAPLAGMGIALLTGFGIERILTNRVQLHRRALTIFGATVTTLALFTSLFVWIVYPRILPSLEGKILNAYSQINSLTGTSAFAPLRKFQIHNLSAEVSLLNPEVTISLIGLLLFVYGCNKISHPRRNSILIGALVISALPVLMFHARFKPNHLVSMWHNMADGGKAQNAVREHAGNLLRIDESRTEPNQVVFPNALASLYGVHAVQGYSALQPPSLFNTKATNHPEVSSKLWEADLVDIDFTSSSPLMKKPMASSRFRSSTTADPLPVEIRSETMNTLTIQVPQKNTSLGFIRTDTWYPGWKEDGSASISMIYPCFSMVIPEKEANRNQIKFRYRPTGLNYALPAITSGICIILLLFGYSLMKQRVARSR